MTVIVSWVRADLHDDVHLERGAGAKQDAFALETREPGKSPP